MYILDVSRSIKSSSIKFGIEETRNPVNRKSKIISHNEFQQCYLSGKRNTHPILLYTSVTLAATLRVWGLVFKTDVSFMSLPAEAFFILLLVNIPLGPATLPPLLSSRAGFRDLYLVHILVPSLRRPCAWFNAMLSPH